jgi:uncharacterized repeat protein (TIGR03803 family)
LLGNFVRVQASIIYTYDAAGNRIGISALSGSTAPAITQQPLTQISGTGYQVSFSVGATGSQPLAYQWLFNNAIIPGATSSTFFIPSVTGTSFGNYSVKVSNSVASVTSRAARLLLDSTGSGLPDAWQLEYFGNLLQTAAGDYDLDGVSNLEKFLEGTNPTDPLATRVTLTVSSLGDVLVQPNEPDYARGQQVTLTAVSGSTTQFSSWGGDATGSANPLTVTMNANLAITANFSIPLVIALDDSRLAWTTDGEAGWYGQAATSHDDISAAQSGSLGSIGQSQMETEVTGPGKLGFWWQVSSNPGFNNLAFSVDGQEQAIITGTTSWAQQSFPIASGTHQLAWTYVKTAPPAGDADAGWVDQVSFVTGANPVTPPPASSIGEYGALANGSATLSATDPMVYFNYGATATYGASTPFQDLGTGSGSISFDAPLSGLAPNTTYYYQVVEVIGGTKTIDGPQQTFTTLPLPPGVTTNSATSVASSSATLNATVDPNGAATYVRFDYGLDASYGNSTPAQAAGSANSPVSVSASLTNLEPNVTYHYRAVAINSGGSSSGSDQSFSTSSGFVTLYSFTGNADGENPNGCTLGSDGNLYGTAQNGGAIGLGTVFKITPGGAFTLLDTFNNEYNSYLTQGSTPAGPLFAGSDGNFWGATNIGGTDNLGTLFSVSPAGALTTLHWYSGPDGSTPCPPIQGTDGSYYGVTTAGGLYGFGTIFRMTAAGVYSVLHSFNGSDGSAPSGQLVEGTDGNFYGTTPHGGSDGYGSVFMITPGGVFTTLHSFGSADGNRPYTGLLLGADGNFYGVTYDGGDQNDGTIFEMTPAGDVTTLHSFIGSDGANPNGNGLINGNDGYLYGTTDNGGSGGNGTIFKISPDGAIFTTIHFFEGSDGSDPNGGLTRGADGNLYGTTWTGGQNGDGTIYQVITAPMPATNPPSYAGFDSTTLSGSVTPNGIPTLAWFDYGQSISYGSQTPVQNLGSGTAAVTVIANLTGLLPDTTYHYQLVEMSGSTMVLSPDQTFVTGSSSAFTMIHSFSGPDGAYPYVGLLQSSGKTLYGTTDEGGASGDGAIFSVDTGGALSVLHSFDGDDGSNPDWVTIDSQGNLYGGTYGGGQNGDGTIYRLGADGNLTTLHAFDGADGKNADGPIQLDSAGNLYGVTPNGGADGDGTVYKLSASGSLSSLIEFNGANGSNPYTLFGTGGYYYGVTANGGGNGDGTIFRVTASGSSTTFYTFDDSDGSYPNCELIRGQDGNLYGDTENGGDYGDGTIFKISLSGSLTTLYSFSGGDGSSPRLGLVQAPNGTLYGTTYYGGANNEGTIFSMTLSGSLSTLHSFDYANGANPYSQLLIAADGSLYGTTLYGGGSDDGTIYRYTPGSVPIVMPVAAASLSATGAVIAGLVDPNGVSTSAYFQYGTTPSLGSVTKAQSLGAGKSTLAVSASLAGLLANTTYYYRLVETGGNGTIVESIETFTTPPAPPVVETGAPSQVTANTANLTASVDPNGVNTALYFQYGETTAYGRAGGAQQLGAYMGSFDVSYPLAGLIPSTTYHYRAVATGATGTVFGADQSFTTAAAPLFKPPLVTTGTAIVGQGPNAILRGSVNPNGTGAIAYFDFGPTNTYGNSTPGQLVGSGTGAVAVSGSISGLTPGVTYHFRMVAADHAGTVAGLDKTFIAYNPFLAVAGVYNGLITCPLLSNSTTGLFRASTTSTGTFTASLLLGGFGYPLEGSFDGNGNFTATIARAGKSALTVSINLDLSTGNQITGTVFDGFNTSEISASRCPYSSQKPAPQAGTYTVLVQPDFADSGNAFPQGNGFAAMTVSKLGAVTVTGKLGDGTAFTAGGYVTIDDSFPFYVALYPSQPGGIEGNIVFESIAGRSDCAGPLVWFKPPQTGSEVIYDAVNDFSINSNPNGVWSYGTLTDIPGGTFSPFTTAQTGQDFTGEEIWDNNGSSDAGVISNITGSIASFETTELPPDELLLAGDYLISDVRWTAATSGTYNIDGLFERDVTNAQPVSVSIIENGTNALFSASNFTTYGSQQIFSFSSVTLPAGATLDFAKNPGPSYNTGTGFKAVIAKLLKPSNSVGNFYANGFTTAVSFIGALYSGTTPLNYASTGGKANVLLESGDLPADINEIVPLVSGTTITLTGTGTEELKLSIVPSTGAISGTFVNPANNQTTILQGEVLQKANIGGGLFIGPAHTGSLIISQ